MVWTTQRSRATWAEHYGPLAGWLLAITGDAGQAHRTAAEAFVQLFARRRPAPAPRTELYRLALRLIETAGGGGSPERPSLAPEAWLGAMVDGLPPVTRRCVLLAHAGFSEVEIARIAHVRRAAVVRQLLALAERDAAAASPPRPAMSPPTPAVRRVVSAS